MDYFKIFCIFFAIYVVYKFYIIDIKEGFQLIDQDIMNDDWSAIKDLSNMSAQIIKADNVLSPINIKIKGNLKVSNVDILPQITALKNGVNY